MSKKIFIILISIIVIAAILIFISRLNSQGKNEKQRNINQGSSIDTEELNTDSEFVLDADTNLYILYDENGNEKARNINEDLLEIYKRNNDFNPTI